MSTYETTSKIILVSLFNNAKISSELKAAIVDEFVANTNDTNCAFQMSFGALKQAVQDNNENNDQLTNIIMHATGAFKCIKMCMFCQ